MVNGRRESPFAIFFLPSNDHETRSISTREPARVAAHGGAGVVRGRCRLRQRRGGALVAHGSRGRRVDHTPTRARPHGTRPLTPAGQAGRTRRLALPL